MVADLAPPQTTLIGRDRELAILRERLAAARAGHGGLVLIGGEAGVGKTALAEALMEEATSLGMLTLVGRCYDLTETPPYGPWLEIAQRVRALLPDLPALADVPLPSLAAASTQATLFSDVEAFLTTLAAHRPLVVVLDDQHWADAASLHLLRFLARGARYQPLLLVVAYRGDELGRRDPLYQLLPALEHDAHPTRIDLSRLDRAEVRTLAATLRPMGDPDLDRLVAYLMDRAGGNAFYTLQFLRALEEAGTLAPSGIGWTVGDLELVRLPASLLRLIDARVLRLDTPTQEALAVAAIIGAEVPVGLWSSMIGLGEEDLIPLVEEAAAARLIEALPDGSRVRFVHALVREALYEGILPLRRRGLHRQVGAALLATPDPDPDAVAYHLRLAGDERAADWLIRAGERAIQSFAVATASDRYIAALTLLDAVEGDPGRRARLRLRLAMMRGAIDSPTEMDHLASAASLVVRAHDPVLTAWLAIVRGAILVFRGAEREGLAEMKAGVDALDALTPDAALEREDPPEHYAAFLNRANYVTALAYAGCFREAREGGERLLESVTEPVGSMAYAIATAGAWSGLEVAYAMLGQPEDARRAAAGAEAAHDVLRRNRLLGPRMRDHFAAAMLHYTANPDERERLVDDAHEVYVHQLGAPAVIDASAVGYVRLPFLFSTGRWRESRAAIDAISQAFGGTHLVNLLTCDVDGEIARAQGDAEHAWRVVGWTWPDGPATEPGPSVVFRALTVQRLAVALALDAGDLPTARAWLEAHDRWLEWTGAVLGRAEGHELWARYARLSGDLDGAWQRGQQALAAASAPRQPLAMLAAHWTLGQVATDLGRYDEAEFHLGEALALAEACGAPYERALTLLARAELVIASRAPHEAAPTLAEIRTICVPLEARPVLDRVEDLAASLAAPLATKVVTPDRLSAREVEILRLVARGLSNQEIADALYLSVRTVERHVTNAYGKIGAHGRAAATAYVLQHLTPEGCAADGSDAARYSAITQFPPTFLRDAQPRIRAGSDGRPDRACYGGDASARG